MKSTKNPTSEKIKLFFDDKKQDIIEAIYEVRDSNLLRILIWSLLFFLVIAFVIIFRSYANSNPKYLRIQGFAFAIAIYFYILLIFPFYKFLNSKLYGLIVPKESKFDSETYRNTGFLTIGIILCMTAMIFLLIFDYFQHSKEVPGIEPPLVTEIQKNSSEHRPVPKMQEPPAPETPVFLGTYGDFFGGVVNPVLTFGTLIALAITILMQRLQLRDARNETKENSLHAQQQAFESTFFNLLSLHTENVKNLRFEDDDTPGQKAPEGRAVFASILAYLERDSKCANDRLTRYRLLQKNKNDILGHYFRHLYQILNHIENFKASMTSNEKYIFQKRYANILRAQQSSHELVLLFFNCTKGTVDEGRFRDLVVKYEFLEHLPATEGEDGVPSVPELGLHAGEIFLDYFPNKLEVWSHPQGAFGKNKVFKRYIEAKKAADAEAAHEVKRTSSPDSSGPVIG